MIEALTNVRYRGLFIAVGLAGLIVLGVVLTRILSPKSSSQLLLDGLWQQYKQQSWDSASGQTTNKQAGQTTSEGQSYTLLRAVWQGDQSVFDKTWQWTTGHLQRPDKLFSWLWSPQGGSSTAGPNNQGNSNTASDADSDIAMALLMAGQRWHNDAYTEQAKQIIRSIWHSEVVTIDGRPYVAADNVEKTSRTASIVVNPSYYSPAAYRLFARVDPADNWMGLVNNSYTFINKVSQAPLDTGHSAGLPPDWVLVDRHTGALSAPTGSGQTTNFSYNAFRTVWRLGLDWNWFHDPSAEQSLRQFSFLPQQWTAGHRLLADYSHDGQPLVDYSSLALYGGSLGYFVSQQPAEAKDVISSQLYPLYDAKTGRLKQQLDYYDNNWVWFGVALYANRLPNLAKGVRA